MHQNKEEKGPSAQPPERSSRSIHIFFLSNLPKPLLPPGFIDFQLLSSNTSCDPVSTFHTFQFHYSFKRRLPLSKAIIINNICLSFANLKYMNITPALMQTYCNYKPKGKSQQCNLKVFASPALSYFVDVVHSNCIQILFLFWLLSHLTCALIKHFFCICAHLCCFHYSTPEGFQ